MDKVTVDFNVGGILSVLLIIFIVLKVTNVISWSWGLVLLPLWIGLGLVGFVFIIAVIIAIIAAIKS